MKNRNRGLKQTVIAASLAAICMFMVGTAAARQDGIPALDHVFVIVLENHGYSQIIGNSNAPAINALAAKYNQATDYTAVAHPSLPNYLAMIAGDYFGVNNDRSPAVSVPPGPWSLNAPTIGSQLEAVGKDWRAYMEDIPAAGSLYADWPGDPDTGGLYVARHDPFPYFQVHQNPAAFSKMVPLTDLFGDLAGDGAPALSFIVPNQCNNMHNNQDKPLSPCSGASDPAIIARGDHETGLLVKAIMGSDAWKKGENALFILTDEEENMPISDPVLALVITNYGVEGVKDPTYYNHYSLLKTIEAGFGLPYLGHAADATTHTMAPMLAAKDPK